jgi:hypothetical protein
MMCRSCVRDVLVEEFLFLRSCGLGWWEITRQLGYTNPDSLDRMLERAGRPDLCRVWRAMVEDEGSWGQPGWLTEQNRSEAARARPVTPRRRTARAEAA